MKRGTFQPMRFSLLIAGILLFSCVTAGASATQHRSHSGDLVSALEFISTTYHLPVIAELTKSYPADISLPQGDDTADQLVSALASQPRGYSWVIQDGVLLFYDIALHDAPGNMFNKKIKTFLMPANAAELVLQLNQLLGSDSGTAPVMAGVPEAALLKVPLQKGVRFTDVNGREVLLAAARQCHNLFSVAVFPSRNPRTQDDMKQARTNWFVRSIDELKQNPTRLRSMPAQQ